MKFSLKPADVTKALGISSPDLPKYVWPILNLANQFAQATRHEIVGQVTELFPESKASSLAEWAAWYAERKPDGIRTAGDKLEPMVKNLREVMATINRTMIDEWVTDLVVTKTFAGLQFQEAIMKDLGGRFNLVTRLPTTPEERQGIDGFIGDQPVQIKPESYRNKPALHEEFPCPVVYYEKVKGSVKVDASELAARLPKGQSGPGKK